MKRLKNRAVDPSRILSGAAVGIVTGTIMGVLGGLALFRTPWCLVLALVLLLYAFLRPSLAFLVIALVAGMGMGLWRAGGAVAENLSAPKTGWSAEKVEERGVFDDFKDGMAEGVREYVPEEEANLGLSYLLGMKGELSKQTSENLRAVGLTHVVVASGTHLSILVEFMRKIFGKVSRLMGTLMAGIFVLLFATMIGWTASITRAAVVTLLGLVAGYTGRRFHAGRLILLAMATTLMINPMNLTELGWQLSFSSYAGIMLIAPILKAFFYGEKKPGLWSEVLIASVSAALLCLPLQIYYFGAFSLLSLPANLLILPTMPLAMGLTFLTGAGALCVPIGWLAGKLTTLVLDFHLAVIGFLAAQEPFLLEVPAGQAQFFLLYLIPLLLVLISVWRRQWDRCAKSIYWGWGRDPRKRCGHCES